MRLCVWKELWRWSGALRCIGNETNEPAGSQMIPSCCLVSALLPRLSLLQPLCSFISPALALASASPSAAPHSRTPMSHYSSSFASDPFVLSSNYGKLTLDTHQMSCFRHFVCCLQNSGSLNILPGCASRGCIPAVVISGWEVNLWEAQRALKKKMGPQAKNIKSFWRFDLLLQRHEQPQMSVLRRFDSHHSQQMKSNW